MKSSNEIASNFAVTPPLFLYILFLIFLLIPIFSLVIFLNLECSYSHIHTLLKFYCHYCNASMIFWQVQFFTFSFSFYALVIHSYYTAGLLIPRQLGHCEKSHPILVGLCQRCLWKVPSWPLYNSLPTVDLDFVCNFA